MPRKSMFICGDFNIDLMKYETHNGTKRFLDCMYGLGLCPLIDRPSRITTHSCTLIDNIFTNQINYEIENKKSDPVKCTKLKKRKCIFVN